MNAPGEETEDGWGSDDLDDLEDDDGWNATTTAEEITPITTNRKGGGGEIIPPISSAIDGWEDDDDLDVQLDDEEAHHYISSSERPSDELVTQLQEYIQSIPFSIVQVNKLLEKEYNTPEKAMELQQYYSARPHLLQYTLEKELPRMDYTVISVDGGVHHKDPTVIARILQEDTLCGRCANQSLLADVLHVLSTTTTTGNPIVPARFLATAVATNCHFTIDVPTTVHVQAQFQVSLPSSRGRWKIGHLPVTVDFRCPVGTPPRVQFRLSDWRPLTDTDDPASLGMYLQECAAILKELHHDEEELAPPPILPEGGDARDALVQQLLWSTTSDAMHGMQSAWQDLDAATGLVTKLQQFPTWLPSPVQEEDIAPPQSRPTSILGGIVRSIAQSLPSVEEDPRLYEEEWRATISKEPAIPHLYHPPEAPSDHNNNRMTRTTEIPKLYNMPPERERPVATVPPVSLNPQSIDWSRENTMAPTHPVAMAEGWDDDVDDLLDDDDEEPSIPTHEEEETNEWTWQQYDPVTDRIPTRTRWVNPIPGPRDLRYL